MLYKIQNQNHAVAFENWAKENNVSFEELDEGNYVDACPDCGASEFWHGGTCGHCGYFLERKTLDDMMTNCQHLIANGLAAMTEADMAGRSSYGAFFRAMECEPNRTLLKPLQITKRELHEIAEYVLYTYKKPRHYFDR